MKKFKMITVVSAATLLLSACNSSTPAATATTEATATAEATAETAGTWSDLLVKANTITVGISPDYPPFESYATDGSMEGFDVDMSNSLAPLFGDGYTIEFVPMSFDTIITAVQSGQVDLGISGFTYDKDRQVLFSEPYLSSAEVVLISADSGITSVADLNGKTIAAQSGSTAETAAGTVEGAKVEIGTDAQVLVEALKTGAYDGVVLDLPVAQNYIAADSSLSMIEEPLITEDTCIIAKQGNEMLMDKVNEALATYMASSDYTDNKTKWELE